MQVKKSLLVTGAVATVGLASLTGIGAVSAATTGTGGDSLVSKIAQKFNLKESDVQAVFDEAKTEREAKHQAALSDHLQQLVDDGKITANQKTLIENKVTELQKAREDERTALEAWAKEKGIDVKYVMMGGHGGDTDRLQQLVDDGKITADQKTAIAAKQDELKDKRDADRDALEKWASDNNIDAKYLMMGGGRGGHGGPGGPRGGF